MELTNFRIFGISGENIILTVSSICFGMLVAYVFYRLQKRDSNSAQKERLRRGRDELIEIIESVFINKQEFTVTSIDNLVSACGRKHNISFVEPNLAIDLLQDVILRIQKSPHLDIIQKNDLVNKIENFISTSEFANISPGLIESKILDLIDSTKEIIDKEKYKTVFDNLIKLKSMIGKYLENRYNDENSTKKWSYISSFSVGVAAVIAVLAINYAYEFTYRSNQLEDITLSLKDNFEKIKPSVEYIYDYKRELINLDDKKEHDKQRLDELLETIKNLNESVDKSAKDIKKQEEILKIVKDKSVDK